MPSIQLKPPVKELAGDDGAHRLTRATDNRPYTYGDMQFSYDDPGNLRRKGDSWLKYEGGNAGPHGVTNIEYSENPGSGGPTPFDPCGTGVPPSSTDTDEDDIPDVCQCGDINGDGGIGFDDATCFAQCVQGTAQPPCDCLSPLADTNGDDSIGFDDATRAAQVVQETLRSWELHCAERPDPSPVHDQVNAYTYDTAGRVITKAVDREMGDDENLDLVWDAEDRLATLTGMAFYGYDVFGIRVRKQGAAVDDIIYVDGDYEANVTAGIHRKHVFLGGQRVLSIQQDGVGNVVPSQVTNQKEVHYFPDHLGTSLVMTDETGFYTRVVTDPFGQVMAQVDQNDQFVPLPSAYVFTGHHYDEESDFHYMQTRYYDPLAGRFLTPDPALRGGPSLGAMSSVPQTLNGYSYVVNQPTALTDPSGQFFQAAAIAFAVSLAVGATDGQLTGEDLLMAGLGAATAGFGAALAPASTAVQNSTHYTIGVANGSAQSFSTQHVLTAVGGAGMERATAESQGNPSGISESEQALLDGAQDGHLTLGEANAHYRHGNGEPVDVDASKLRVHTRNGINGTVQGDDYLVHGQVTIRPETGRIYDGAYGFEQHTPSGPLDVRTRMRNVATRIGAWRAGEGTPFTIRYRGQPTLVRPAHGGGR